MEMTQMQGQVLLRCRYWEAEGCRDEDKANQLLNTMGDTDSLPQRKDPNSLCLSFIDLILWQWGAPGLVKNW